MDGPQTSEFCSTPPPTSGRQQRHLAFISEYTNQLKYLPGTFNVVADALLQLPDDLARAPTVFVRGDGHVPPLQPLYDGPYTIIRRSLHHFTLRIGEKVDKVSTLRLKPCTDPTAPPALPRVRGRPPAAVRFRDFPPPATGGPPGTLCPTATSRTAPGTVFPWHAARGFCTPRRRSRPHRRSVRPHRPSAVQIRPLGLRPRGLGGAL